MKNTKTGKRVLSLVFVVLLVFSVTACGRAGSGTGSGGGLFGLFGNSDKKEICNTIQEFQYACNNLDLNAMLNCIDPDVAQPVKLLVAIGSGVTDNDYEDFLDEAIEMIFGTELDVKSSLPDLKLEPTDYDIEKETANVNVDMKFELSGQEFKYKALLTVKKVDEKWYIVDGEMI